MYTEMDIACIGTSLLHGLSSLLYDLWFMRDLEHSLCPSFVVALVTREIHTHVSSINDDIELNNDILFLFYMTKQKNLGAIFSFKTKYQKEGSLISETLQGVYKKNCPPPLAPWSAFFIFFNFFLQNLSCGSETLDMSF